MINYVTMNCIFIQFFLLLLIFSIILKSVFLIEYQVIDEKKKNKTVISLCRVEKRRR